MRRPTLTPKQALALFMLKLVCAARTAKAQAEGEDDPEAYNRAYHEILEATRKR